MDIPVWHDDQQGTATIVTAGAINAHKVVGKKISESKVAMVGAGAANIAIARIMVEAGFNIKNIVMCDSKGTLHAGREDIKNSHAEKWFMCENSNAENVVGDIETAMKGADIVVAASRPGPGVLRKNGYSKWLTTLSSSLPLTPFLKFGLGKLKKEVQKSLQPDVLTSPIRLTTLWDSLVFSEALSM